MNDAVIQIEGLSKRYRLGAGPAGKGDFRDAAAAAFRRATAPLRRARPDDHHDAEPPDERELWALHDVSFTVRRGEVVGLIGRNGAGKSTLLKILSRITDPTAGDAYVRGRVGSLLEVGTGFHPELTGRENIYLNGAILGMSRRHIDDHFDEIVAFSEIGRFLDTPVKRYSSGMYVRLAFSVAAHLQPEVLVIDEVLAVGDAAFQSKCVEKIKQIARDGRTILFVSHNMGSVQSLCERAVVLEQGRVVTEGPPAEAIKRYLATGAGDNGRNLAARTDRQGRGRTRIVAAGAYSEGHEDAPNVLRYGLPAVLWCEVDKPGPDQHCAVTLLNHVAQRVCRFASRTTAPRDAVEPGRRFAVHLPALTLVPGRYWINLSLFTAGHTEDQLDTAVTFEVQTGELAGRPLAREQRDVVFAPAHHWTVPQIGGAS